MSVSQDQILLSLAHSAMSPKLLQSLIESTSSTCNAMLLPATINKPSEIASKRARHSLRCNAACTRDELQQGKGEDEPSDLDADDLIEEQVFGSNVRLLLTGSPSLHDSIPGKKRADWDSTWSAGEKVFGKVIDEVGLFRFHKIPDGNQRRLVGNLIDFTPEYSNFACSEDWRTTLEREMIKIGIQIQQVLSRQKVQCIQKVVILLPLEKQFLLGSNEVMALVQNVLHKTWSKCSGPLNRVEISTQIVQESV